MHRIFLVISLLIYLLGVNYFDQRVDFWLYFWGMLVLFALYAIVTKKAKLGIKETFYWGLLFRLVFLFSLPVLSDDVYRFIWDGFLTKSGLNPYQFLPSTYDGPMISSLLDKLNSPNYFSVYPPLNQYIFALSSSLSGHSILAHLISMRTLLIAAGMLNIFFIYRIALLLNRNEREAQKLAALYAFNPFIIYESIGNFHFEGLMLCFLFASYYLFLKQKNLIWVATLFAFAISIKLLPLLFLPLLWRRLGLKKGFHFVVIVFLWNVVLFLPFYKYELLLHIFSSIDLYFHKFEFNASIYYFFREIGFLLTGFNIIQWLGSGLAMLSFLLILRISFKRQQLFVSAVFILSIYFFLSTTMHPWYLITLFGISLFTPYRYPLIWTAVIGLSYFSYTKEPIAESRFFLIIEYLAVFGLAFYELKREKYLWFDKE